MYIDLQVVLLDNFLTVIADVDALLGWTSFETATLQVEVLVLGFVADNLINTCRSDHDIDVAAA